MRESIVSVWDAFMDNRKNPLRHMDLASQHYFMQVLGWMWSMVFSLSFLSILEFGVTWMLHIFGIGGIAMTVAVFKEAEKRSGESAVQPEYLSASSRCVWKLDTEA